VLNSFAYTVSYAKNDRSQPVGSADMRTSRGGTVGGDWQTTNLRRHTLAMHPLQKMDLDDEDSNWYSPALDLLENRAAGVDGLVKQRTL